MNLNPGQFGNTDATSDGMAAAHGAGLHQGSPDPKSCFDCHSDSSMHIQHDKDNADPKCAYCKPKKN